MTMVNFPTTVCSHPRPPPHPPPHLPRQMMTTTTTTMTNFPTTVCSHPRPPPHLPRQMMTTTTTTMTNFPTTVCSHPRPPAPTPLDSDSDDDDNDFPDGNVFAPTVPFPASLAKSSTSALETSGAELADEYLFGTSRPVSISAPL
eukprot:TRINITY_DN12623_c0_g1_i2.p2 TRINITY_DN12623_c0_g1~~TRINITY_DN12623_c0_g1_i2.p2  ORF type:complete len:145 (+),score=20.52 TRINITY_DN12623_c0_g1_i2:425-859(+)